MDLDELVQATVEAAMRRLDTGAGWIPRAARPAAGKAPGRTLAGPDPLKPCPSANTECVICYETCDPPTAYDFVVFPTDAAAQGTATLKREHRPVSLPCGHVYGESCARAWLEKSPQCPLCRASVDEGKAVHVFATRQVPRHWVGKQRGTFTLPLKE